MKTTTKMVCAALGALALIGPTLARLPVSQARADSYQVQEGAPTDAASDPIRLDGVVNHVDADRDRVTFTGDDGHDYTLDTSRADITLPDTTQPGDVSDLTPGMRLHVVGRRLSDDVIVADRVRVLHDAAAPALPAPPAPSDGQTQHIDLRGTVESINKHDDSFVVRVNDHTRTIFLDTTTDLIKGNTQEDYPLRPGDRVTVSGSLHDDGTVVADTVILGRSQDDAGR